MIPESEPILLDLEKLLLLSDSMENHDCSGKNGKQNLKCSKKKIALLFPIISY